MIIPYPTMSDDPVPLFDENPRRRPELGIQTTVDTFNTLTSSIADNYVPETPTVMDHVIVANVPLDTTQGRSRANSMVSRSSDSKSTIVNVEPQKLYQNPTTPQVLPSPSFYPQNPLARFRYEHRDIIGEFLGTFFMMLVGNGSVAQFLVAAPIKQSYTVVVMSWGVAVMFGYLVSGGASVSGGHLNPAITLTSCMFRKFPWKRLPGYWAAQISGAFCASLLVFGVYRKLILDFDPGLTANSLPIFCTVPMPQLDTHEQVVSEFVASMALQMAIFAMSDPYTTAMSGLLFPLGLFFALVAIGGALAIETSFALNMARDLGPRLAAYALGYERKALWEHNEHYFWVPIVVPFIGCVAGAVLYDVCIFQGHESFINSEWEFPWTKGKKHDDVNV